MSGTLVTYNNLTLHSVSRSDLHSNITCEATNYNNSVQTKTISLDMNFLPLKIEVLNKESELQVGEKRSFKCEAYGSRPPADITWWLDNQKLEGDIYSPAPMDGTTSTSIYTIRPTEAHSNRTLTCRAENKMIKQGVLKESWLLDILFPPRLALKLSSMLEKGDVSEGSGVIFVCNIRANPPITRMVEWFHNGHLLKQNKNKGILMTSNGENLVLQDVKKEANGNYTCSATNGVPNVGHTVQSQPFHLDVKYHPVCVPEGVKVYGVAKEENVRIQCQVAANPSNISFRWIFNNSAEIKHVSQDKFTSNGTVSFFHYKPERELDYGTLMCWSRNSVGEQSKPCVFHIIAAGKPDPVKNCSISNVTSSAFQISCTPGFNGGLPQNFTIQVVNNEAIDAPVHKDTSDKPVFNVHNLNESTEYRVYITPINMKGLGQPQSQQGTTVRTYAEAKPVIENPEKIPENRERIDPLLIIIFGGASGILLVIISILLAVKIRCSQRPPQVSHDNGKMAVTTITDVEFHDDHGPSDRMPLALDTNHGGKHHAEMDPDTSFMSTKSANTYLEDSFESPQNGGSNLPSLERPRGRHGSLQMSASNCGAGDMRGIGSPGGGGGYESNNISCVYPGREAGGGGSAGGSGHPHPPQYQYCTMRKHNPLPHLIGNRNLSSSTAELIDCSASDIGSRKINE